MSKHNWHAIVGPNGMCECGVRADGTVVTCGDLLAAETEQANADALDQANAESCACRHDGRGDLVSECQAHEEQRKAKEQAEARLAAVQEKLKEATPMNAWTRPRELQDLVAAALALCAGQEG